MDKKSEYLNEIADIKKEIEKLAKKLGPARKQLEKMEQDIIQLAARNKDLEDKILESESVDEDIPEEQPEPIEEPTPESEDKAGRKRRWRIAVGFINPDEDDEEEFEESEESEELKEPEELGETDEGLDETSDEKTEILASTPEEAKKAREALKGTSEPRNAFSRLKAKAEEESDDDDSLEFL